MIFGPGYVYTVLTLCVYGIALFSIAFFLITAFISPSIVKKRKLENNVYPPVTILKPLKGAETGLFENLKSFCEIDYPEFQMILTVTTPDDPAAAVAQKIKEQFPHLDIQLVFSGNNPPLGLNPKINNVSSAQPFIKHDFLMMTDSDVRVQKDFLKQMVEPFLDPNVGLVTSFYQGAQSRKFWPTMEALSINAYFLPQALTAYAFGMRFAMGPAMLIRRDIFEEIGGFSYQAKYLADDFILGEAVKSVGLKIAASHSLIECFTEDSGGLKYFKHQIRWAHTIRICRPSGYLGLLFLHGFSLLALLIIPFGVNFTALLLMTAVILAKFLAQERILNAAGIKSNWKSFFLLPISELIIFCAWVLGWRRQPVSWRGKTYSFPQSNTEPVLTAAER